jgi:hypothetical protein
MLGVGAARPTPVASVTPTVQHIIFSGGTISVHQVCDALGLDGSNLPGPKSRV